MTEVYLDQLTFSGGRSVPCQPAYHVVATTSSPTELFLPLPVEDVPTGLPLGVELEAVAMLLPDLGLREHMGAAHTVASWRAARRERGRNMRPRGRRERV